MIIADLNNVGRLHGGRVIFRGLSLTLGDGERIGLIGPSGCGKSTLLRVIAGEDSADEGAVTFRRGARIAYLPQEFTGNPDRAVIEELISGREDLALLADEMAAAEREMGDPDVLADADRFDVVLRHHAKLLEEYDRAGGLMLRNRAEGLLRALGLDEDAWQRPMAVLSGGQRKLVGIARCLLADPDLLLLDEPDNHLDLARKAALERIIREFPGCVVVISHDRYLLDETVSTIVEMEAVPARDAGIRLKRWEGNYSSYVTQRQLALVRQAQDFQSQQKEIARLESAVARFKLWARLVVDERHIKQARNKQRQIDSMEKVERPVLERRKMALAFRRSERGGNKVVELRSVSKSYGENIVLLDSNLTVMTGERIGIVGGNGSGKSVLLRVMLGEETPDEGATWTGPSIRMSRYAQEHETLDFGQTPVQAIRAVKAMMEGEAVAQLTKFLLPYDVVHQPIANLSGGEKSRVQLARLMLANANCLALDEPTNNLDIPAAEVLETALEAFAGTVIVVSHDRYLLDRLADRIVEVKDGTVTSFPGGYSAYIEELERRNNPPPPVIEAPPPPPSRPKRPTRL